MRKLMWLTIGFGSACVFGTYFYNAWLLPMAVVFLLLAAVCFVLTRWKMDFRVGCAIFLGIALGLSVFNLYDLLSFKNVRNIDGKTESAIIEVTDYSYPTRNGGAFDGKILLKFHQLNFRIALVSEQINPLAI